MNGSAESAANGIVDDNLWLTQRCPDLPDSTFERGGIGHIAGKCVSAFNVAFEFLQSLCGPGKHCNGVSVLLKSSHKSSASAGTYSGNQADFFIRHFIFLLQ